MKSYVVKSLQCLILCVALYFGLLIFPSAVSCDVVLFNDNFENGNADNWEIVEYGEWEVIDGQYCLLTV